MATREYNQKYYEQHKERILENSRRWYRENKTHARQLSSRWYAEHPDQRRATRKVWREKKPEHDVLLQIRHRAKRKNVPFNLDIEDIIIPDICPVLGIPLVKGEDKICDNSPTVDRIIPSLGYVKGNIQVISNRANRIKNDATLEEIRLVYEYIKRQITERSIF